MPVGEKDMGERNSSASECLVDEIRPFRDALACIDDETFGARPYDERVCSLQGKLPVADVSLPVWPGKQAGFWTYLARVLAEDPEDTGADLLDIRQ